MPPHPQLQRAAGRRSQVRRRAVPLAALALATIVIIVVSFAVNSGGKHPTFANSPYTPQIGRNFESVVSPTSALSDQAVDDIAKNNAYYFEQRWGDNFNIQGHFSDARRIVDAGKKYGNNVRVFEYFSAAYWFNANVNWGSYAKTFQQSWLLHDTQGKTIPFFGAANLNGIGQPEILGYALDLSNPGFRAWAVSTIVSWMRAAPYAGVSFDNANPISGTDVSRYISDGKTTFNQLLCGAPVSLASGSCDRVQQWNAGLNDLLTQTSAALAKLGDQVRYNGISPAPARGVSRNVGLLQYTHMAANEGFCMSASTSKPSKVSFTSFTADAAIMKSVAAQRKIVTENTSTYQTSTKQKYGDYCVAGFLIGWQPGSSYFDFHAGYGYPPAVHYPLCPEQNLNLGDPLSTDYDATGNVLSRRFQNGFVAVNESDSSAQVTVPMDLERFANGSAAGRYSAGQSVTLPPRSALLGLNATFVLGPSATTHTS